MENIITITILVVAVYCLLKFIEMKWLDDKTKIRPLKHFARDVMFVLVSAFIGSFMYLGMSYHIADFMNVLTENKTIHSATTQIFTDAPGF
jgi:uncharacterized membrane protein YfcA